jgi:hypothetical protein
LIYLLNTCLFLDLQNHLGLLEISRAFWMLTGRSRKKSRKEAGEGEKMGT